MKLHLQNTIIGTIGIAEHDGFITNLYFADTALPADIERVTTAVLKEAFVQLNRYLEGDLKTFSLPLAPAGTPFMLSVWRILSTIPYGTTVSYKDIAIAVGNSRASRAVGMANHRNPLPVFIPCHRVIGSNGAIGGYGGGVELKTILLKIEGRDIRRSGSIAHNAPPVEKGHDAALQKPK